MSEKLAYADGKSLQATYPPGIRWDIDIPGNSTPLKLIDAAIEKYADKDALDFIGRKITYRELGKMIDDTAHGLTARGIGPGTKLGLHMPNSPYFLVLQLAAWRAGATVVPYSVLDKNKEKMKNQIADSGTTIMATLDLNDFYAPVTDLLEQGALKQIIRCPLLDALPDEKGRPAKFIRKLPAPVKDTLLFIMGKVPPLRHKAEELKQLYAKLAPPLQDDPRIIPFDALQKPGQDTPVTEAEAGDTALLQYTSGTTGTLKAAVLTQFNLAANSMQVSEFFKAPSAAKPGEALMEPGRETVFVSIPTDHIFAMTLVLSSLANGEKIVLYPDGRNIKGSLETIQRTKATVMPTVPKILQMMNEFPERGNYDTSSLKTIMAGSEALPAAVRQKFPHEIVEGYGQTEMSPVISCNLQGAFNDVGTLGIIVPRTEAKVVEFGNPDHILNIGEIGELLVRGPQRTPGYHNKPSDTEAVITPDGWLRTGDIVKMTDKLRLIFIDRAKRMLKINGHDVSPLDLEKIVGEHPAVAESVVIGLKDERIGTAAKLIVRLHEGATLTEQDLRKFFDEQKLAAPQKPKYIEFTDTPLLRNGMQKIDWYKIQLAEQEKQKAAQTGNQPKPN